MPHGHVYVRHLTDPARPDVVQRLPDPDPASPRRPAGAVWWPPVMLDPRWAAEADFDVFHLHFGFDACSPETLAELVAVLRARGKPLAFTVHDLRNPHHESSAEHDAQLDVLVPAADALVTLTPGAASEIRRRWGRDAQVLPHPHVVDLALARRLRAERTGHGFRVGLHLKSLRAGMDPLTLLPTLVDTIASIPGGVLQVNGHRDVLDDDGARHHAALAHFVHREAAQGRIDLRVHDYLSDDDLWAYLASLDVSVLPYRFGTHSGWLEACRDLGTTVVAPSCGFYADQGPVLTYDRDETRFDAASLAAAVRQAHARGRGLGADLEERRRQRQRIGAAHEELYAGLLADARPGTPCASA